MRVAVWKGCTAMAVVPFAALASRSAAAQTAAGLPIHNVATLRGDSVDVLFSNRVTLIVAERLDCTLARGDDGTGGSASVILTNTGTGSEAFAVAASGPDGAPRSIAVDDDDGRSVPARRRDLAGTTPVLAPGAAIRLLVSTANGATSSPASTLTVSARATTGSGAPGLLLPGLGDGGGDAVVGASGAAARLTLSLAGETPPTIVETQAVVASDGAPVARRGATVTYTVETRFTAASPAASIVDPIPAGTAYLPASMMLDGTAIADAGRLLDGRVVVPLGAVAAGAVHRLVFKVVIQ